MFKFFKFNNTRLEVPTDRSNFCWRILQYFNIHTLCIPQSLWRGLSRSGIGEQDPRRYTEIPTVFFLWNERTTERNDSRHSIVYYRSDFSRPIGWLRWEFVYKLSLFLCRIFYLEDVQKAIHNVQIAFVRYYRRSVRVLCATATWWRFPILSTAMKSAVPINSRNSKKIHIIRKYYRIFTYNI